MYREKLPQDGGLGEVLWPVGRKDGPRRRASPAVPGDQPLLPEPGRGERRAGGPAWARPWDALSLVLRPPPWALWQGC